MGSAKPGYQRNFLTPADAFYEITRGRPYELDAEARRQAGLTPDTWSLEIVPDDPPWQPRLRQTCRREDGTALTLSDLEQLFRARPVRCIAGACTRRGPQPCTSPSGPPAPGSGNRPLTP